MNAYRRASGSRLLLALLRFCFFVYSGPPAAAPKLRAHLRSTPVQLQMDCMLLKSEPFFRPFPLAGNSDSGWVRAPW